MKVTNCFCSIFLWSYLQRRLMLSISCRTVITHMDRALYCHVFFYLCTCNIFWSGRDYYGPYPSELCWFMKLLLNFTPLGIMLSFCVNITLRVRILTQFIDFLIFKLKIHLMENLILILHLDVLLLPKLVARSEYRKAIKDTLC